MRLPALSGIGDQVVADATRPRAGVLGPPFFIARPRTSRAHRLACFCFFQTVLTCLRLFTTHVLTYFTTRSRNSAHFYNWFQEFLPI